MTSTETLSWNCHLLKGSPVYHFFWDSTHAITSWCMRAKVVAPCLDSEHLWRTISAPEMVLRSAEALIASALAFTLCFCSILLPSLPQFLFSRILLNKLVLVYLKSIPQNLNQRQYLKSHPLSPPQPHFLWMLHANPDTPQMSQVPSQPCAVHLFIFWSGVLTSSMISKLTLTSLVAQMVKRLSTMWETWVRSLGQEDPLEKEMEIHSSTIAWKIPWTEEPGRLQSMGSQRVGHDWATSLMTSRKKISSERTQELGDKSPASYPADESCWEAFWSFQWNIAPNTQRDSFNNTSIYWLFLPNPCLLKQSPYNFWK